jgi:hypothetical protein
MRIAARRVQSAADCNPASYRVHSVQVQTLQALQQRTPSLSAAGLGGRAVNSLDLKGPGLW